MKRTIIALAACATLALTACGGGGSEPTKTVTETSGTNRPSTSAPSAEEAVESAPENDAGLTETEGPGVLDFGESFTYSNGLQVTASKPERVHTTYGPGVAVQVTVVNGTDQTFDPSMSYATMQVGNTEAEEIFDTENGYDGAPMTTVLPDREATFKIAFEGEDASDLVFEFEPDAGIEYGSLIFATDN